MKTFLSTLKLCKRYTKHFFEVFKKKISRNRVIVCSTPLVKNRSLRQLPNSLSQYIRGCHYYSLNNQCHNNFLFIHLTKSFIKLWLKFGLFENQEFLSFISHVYALKLSATW